MILRNRQERRHQVNIPRSGLPRDPQGLHAFLRLRTFYGTVYERRNAFTNRLPTTETRLRTVYERLLGPAKTLI